MSLMRDFKWQADAWDPADVKTFLEWVFWRQGSGFSISSSEYSRIPTGPQLLAMSDQGFGSMGFTHDEVSKSLACAFSSTQSISLPLMALLYSVH